MDNPKRVLEAVVSNIEKIAGRTLAEEEIAELSLWQKGLALQEITSLYGWAVIKEMFESYIQEENERFNQLADKDPEKVSERELKDQQAVVFTVRRMFTAFMEDARSAVEFAIKPSEFVQKAIGAASKNLKKRPENG